MTKRKIGIAKKEKNNEKSKNKKAGLRQVKDATLPLQKVEYQLQEPEIRELAVILTGFEVLPSVLIKPSCFVGSLKQSEAFLLLAPVGWNGSACGSFICSKIVLVGLL